MWHIAKRELYDNLQRLRFALATALLLGLMLINAAVHLREHPVRLQKYHTSVRNAQDILRNQTDLYDIAQKGPGNLYKKPSALRFCADGGESFLSNLVDGGFERRSINELKSFWILAYPSVTPNLKDISPDVTRVDWVFVIGYVLSLIALLFTFDSISHERDQGTLRLMLANPVPRHTVLIGKFLGALISIIIPFTLAVLINLLIISTAQTVHLNAEEWGRLGIIFFVALLYICLFLALGLLVSTRAQRGSVSLVILLLTWVSFVVFMPHTLASITRGFSSPMTSNELWERQNQLHEELLQQHWSQPLSTPRLPSERMQSRGEYIIKDSEQQEELRQAHLTQQIAQVERAGAITRISPAAILQHLVESLAGTGFRRHLQFIENAQRYAREYREFVHDSDRADPDSLHIVGVREGMSQKPVDPQAIPTFEDRLSFSKDFNTAAMELMLLMLFVVVLLSGVYLAFVHVEV